MAQKPIFINVTGNGSATIDLSHDVLTAVIVGEQSTGGILAISDSATYDSTKIVLEVDVGSRVVEEGLNISFTTGLSWTMTGTSPAAVTLLIGR